IYACLLILFPVSVLLVEIILRLSSTSSSPIPVTALTTPPTESLSTALLSTPKSTLIFSNSFTSNSVPGQPHLAELNLTSNSASPPSALLPPPSFNLSASSPLPTDFYLLFKD